MINLRNDYCGVAHKKILEALLKEANNNFVGYGLDEISKEAEEIIKNKIGCQDAKVFFLIGGTITNKIMIGHMLKPYEAVISCDSGHINVHETGAIEQTGHKIIVCDNNNGKLTKEDVLKVVGSHSDEHMVKPKAVYISNPTEFGTVYKKEELQELSKTCKENGLYLYLDGARFACALTSKYNDIDITDYKDLVDAFYIGGTKNGLISGEALVIVNRELQKEFRYSIKHFGGMQSKGFINGIMFRELFKDDLIYEIGKYQNSLAIKLEKGLEELGVNFLMKGETNQLFPIFDNNIIERLKDNIMFEYWERGEEKTVIRFVTHYLLDERDIDNVLSIIKELI